MAVPRGAGNAARQCLEMVVRALGWCLEPRKTEGPAACLLILGISVEYTDDGTIHLRPDSAKLSVWLDSITQALKANRLTSGEAAKLAGRLLFARSSLCGRVGAAQLRRLFRRSHAHGSVRLDESLQRVLIWWHAMLRGDAFRLKMYLHPDRRLPILVYTDATGRGSMGYCIYNSDRLLCSWSMSWSAHV